MITRIATTAAAVAGSLSVCTYALGYLALRARARALGTDPGYTLVDEAYVFAGFRFLLSLLILLVAASPVIAGIWLGVKFLAGLLPTEAASVLRWFVLAAVAVATFLSFRVVFVHGALLPEATGRTKAEGLVIGMEPGRRVGYSLGIVVLVALTSLWMISVAARDRDVAFPLLLGSLLALQIVQLPMYQGALFGDRTVRVLGAVPPGMDAPAGILAVVDHSKERATILCMHPDATRSLTTIKLTDLDGIPVVRTPTIAEFLSSAGALNEGAS